MMQLIILLGGILCMATPESWLNIKEAITHLCFLLVNLKGGGEHLSKILYIMDMLASQKQEINLSPAVLADKAKEKMPVEAEAASTSLQAKVSLV